MNYYTHWDVLDAQPVQTEYVQPLGVRRLKYFSAVGFLMFAVFAIVNIYVEDPWLWALAALGGGFWVGFGSAYRKTVRSKSKK